MSLGRRQYRSVNAGLQPLGQGGLLVFAAVLVLLAFVAWATAPLFHWLWFGIFYRHPIGTLLILAALVGYFLVLNQGRRARAGRWIYPLLVIPLLWGYAQLAGALSQTALVRDLQPQMFDHLPETVEVRYLPMPVAERYGENRIQEPTYHLGDFDPLDIGRELNWAAPRVPSGFWNRLTGRNDGFTIVKNDGSVETITQPMVYGEGMYLTRSIDWQLLRRNYWADYPEIYYVLHGGKVLGVVPYISYRLRFPVWVPYWGGVALFDGDGRIEYLTPDQAQVDPRLVSQRIFPESLARQISEAWAFRLGIANAWLRHEDQVEIPTISDASNQMPYLLPSERGPVWFVAAEPYGPAYGIYKAFWFDAHTGGLSLYQLPISSALIGPNRAAGYVRSAFPSYGWYTRSGDSSGGNIIAIEPRPFVLAGRLYWMVTVTTTDAAGITHTVLVDATDASIRYVNSLAELEDFRAGRFAGRVSAASQPLGQPDPSQSAPPVAPTDSEGLVGLSDEELLRLLRQIVDELSRRQGK